MSREGDYYKCIKRQPVVCRGKATTTSVLRGSQWYVAGSRGKATTTSEPVVCRGKATTASVLRGGQWYVTGRRLLQV